MSNYTPQKMKSIWPFKLDHISYDKLYVQKRINAFNQEYYVLIAELTYDKKDTLLTYHAVIGCSVLELEVLYMKTNTERDIGTW